MSLQVWLPFVKDTTQQGLSSTSITARGSGVSLNTNGKLGNCYYFDGTTNGYMTTNFSTNIGTSDFSIALWVKIPTITSGSYFTICSSKGQSGASAGLGIYWNYSQKKFLWSTSDGTATEIWQADTVDNIVYDKWIHLVMVRESADAKHGYFYINGIRYELASVPAIRNITASTSTLYLGKISNGAYPLKMYLNDFRFYDHALSPKEVKELSKGLVCHYTLGDRGCDNLVPNQSQYNVSTPYILTTTSNDGYKWLPNSSFEVAPSTTYTFSVYCDGEIATAHTGAQGTFSMWLYLCNDGNASKSASGGYDSPICFLVNNYNHIQQGQRHIWQYTTTSTQKYMSIRMNNYGTGGVTHKYWGFKVEKGSKATPWLPNSADPEYTTMGYNDTTVYDSSGYNYHGTINTAMTVSSNTSRYSVSTNFDGDGNSILIPFNAMLGITTASKVDYTISVWTYKTAIGSKAYQTILGGQSGFELEARNASGTDPQYVGWNWGKPTASYEFNKWNLFTFVHTTSDCKIYVNGEYVSSGSSANIPIGDFFIGSWQTNIKQNYQGQMSDFRIYATALSAEDIKALYQVGASIDKSGNMYAYEFNEV